MFIDYVSLNYQVREELWEDFLIVFYNYDYFWVVVGDFNLIVILDDRLCGLLYNFSYIFKMV